MSKLWTQAIPFYKLVIFTSHYLNYCIYKYIHGYVVIMMFEFGEYYFVKLKWKFKFWNFKVKFWHTAFSIGRNFGSIDRNSKKIILKSLDESIVIRFLFNRSKRVLDWLKGTFDWLKVTKQNFLVTIQRVWRGFKPCEQFYETF